MRLLKSSIHPDVENLQGSIFHRRAARAIVLDGESILLLYTDYYKDYSPVSYTHLTLPTKRIV